MTIRDFLDIDSHLYDTVRQILALLILLLLLVMPVTEYFWHFDKFLSGGQDFEFGLLAALAFFGLILVMVQHGKQAIRLLMSWTTTWHSIVTAESTRSVQGSLAGLITPAHTVPLLSLALGLYKLPLLI